MKKTPRKILYNARLLFNREGVNNVRLQDIAKQTDISPGNLSYHFKTKKELIEGLLNQKQQASEDIRALNMKHLSLIHISEPTRPERSRMPSSA